jgi:hypothetical protein
MNLDIPFGQVDKQNQTLHLRRKEKMMKKERRNARKT